MAEAKPEAPDQTAAQSDMLEQTAQAVGMSLRAPTMSVTVPHEDERMLLTQDQVDSLKRGGKDVSFDWCLALGGAGIGFLQNFIASVAAVVSGQAPSKLDLALALVCVGCLAAALAKYTEHRRNKSNTDAIVEKLKSGRRVRVE